MRLVRLMTLGLMVMVASGLGRAAFAAQTPHGVFALITADAPFPSGIYTDTSVVGVTLETNWSDLEPTKGNIDFSFLDSQIALATQNGRQVALRVQPGPFSPKWIYTAGAAKFSFRWYLNGSLPLCSLATIPLPWDPVFLNNWQQLITALGARYASNKSVTMVKLDGINSVTGESYLVYSAGTHQPGAGVCGAAPIAPVSSWKAVGYTPNKVLNAWNTINATFGKAFPTQQLAVETATFPFPPIDNTGQIIAGSNGDYTLVPTMDGSAATALGKRFVLQNDGWTTGPLYMRPSTVPANTHLAYEPLTRITTDTGCLDNGGVKPCNAVTMTTQMVAAARAAGAEYIEMFVNDLQNPALAGPIAGFYP